MISIIICSRTQTISTDLYENIKKTIGCEYELIVIDNSENKYSIFEAYNMGLEKSISECLCFLHDDIFIHTKGWGNSILRVFNEDPQIGLIGVAGAKIKTKMPSAWWDCPEDQKVINIIQHFLNNEKEKWCLGFENELIQEVVSIDGVFMMMRKDNRIWFNTKMTGFHNYDLNISFEYKKYGYKIMVTNEILVEHFSLGTLNEEWVNSTFKIHALYQTILPLGSPQSKINKRLEVSNAINFIDECLKYKNNKVGYSVWVKLFWIHPIAKYHYRFWRKILISN